MPTDPETPPDVEIGAVVRAERLRFVRVPEIEVNTRGEDSVSETDRENLPYSVEPGVTYRDVQVAWRVAARITSGGRRD